MKTLLRQANVTSYIRIAPFNLPNALEREFEEIKISDSYTAICLNAGEMFYQEKELLDSVYEFESDSFLRVKAWNSPINQFLSH